MNYVVGFFFTLLIVGPALVVLLMYPLVGGAGGISTLFRKKRQQPDWNEINALEQEERE